MKTIKLKVTTNHPRPGENMLLRWVVEGHIDATYLRIPFESQSEAKAYMAYLVEFNS